jgi:GNAT superfamily N-acetyltransferase
MVKQFQTMKWFPSFFEGVLVVYYQSLEALQEEGLKGILRPRFFRNRKATPVEMDLSVLPAQTNLLRDPSYQFVELKMETLAKRDLLFTIPSRGIKASRNLKRGWRGFAIIKGDLVVGDVWCVTPGKDGNHVMHPDLSMLGITCTDREAYAFDMYISQDHRGDNLAAPFQRLLQAKLKAEGWRKVYGYYWDDNLPALWMHRMLRFKELPKRQVSRFLFYQRAETIKKVDRSGKASA